MAEKSNSIDLNAYAMGLEHMYAALNKVTSSQPIIESPNHDDLLKLAASCDVKYEVQYLDSELGSYTVPVNLNPDRMYRIITDGSITKVRLNIDMKDSL